jgi:hypothetical protein
MNRLILALVVITPLLLVTGCVTETVYYTPSYSSRYVYNVGGYQGPYWNNAAYYGYEDLNNVGYWGMYDAYTVY